jgi:hypothetical protein
VSSSAGANLLRDDLRRLEVQGLMVVVAVNRQHDGQLQELAWVNVDDRLATISWLAGPPCATSSRSAAPTASPGAHTRSLPVHPHANKGRQRAV